MTTSKYGTISPLQEFLAYEALWDRPDSNFRSLALQLHDYPARLVSTLIEPEMIDTYKKQLLPVIRDLPNFGIRVYGDGEFPQRLKDARHPINILYYQGDWNLTYSPSVAVVGTRNPTQEGIRRTEYLVKRLTQDNIVIVSGLAKGIDTAAHLTAIQNGGFTIAVIGTPLNCYYPLENKELQNKIASDHLLISQVPFSRYLRQTYRENRLFFPERNITMSALTDATIIVEAGETSGTLIQARAALDQGRKLFILENNFLNPALTWPKKYQEKGAIRVKDYDEIREHLSITT
ncbi:MAG: DNA-processing protein DprA [Rhabdochlamydiaceae bacterium]|jgi:DNA processing protein